MMRTCYRSLLRLFYVFRLIDDQKIVQSLEAGHLCARPWPGRRVLEFNSIYATIVI